MANTTCDKQNVENLPIIMRIVFFQEFIKRCISIVNLTFANAELSSSVLNEITKLSLPLICSASMSFVGAALMSGCQGVRRLICKKNRLNYSLY